MDQLVFKMEEPPELEQIDDSSMFKMEPNDSDVDFGPQMRIRSNTWPLPRPDNYVDEPSPPTSAKLEDFETLGGELSALLSESKCNGGLLNCPTAGGLALKKTATSRRNAWGSSSYADLISQAIQSSPEQRLTLSQIYDWMIQNVPYFKDKGDSNSSAGWKLFPLSGELRGKRSIGRKRFGMLRDVLNGRTFEQMKEYAQDREKWRTSC
ncbi:hypothetical protein M8J77_011446 [Diaphorina citri]|nr:hypothetical protein M8J77_011446 [Diaphorina citri]